MAKLFYYARRGVAILLGLALTGYSAWASWHHSHDVIGPLAAVSAAVLLALAEYTWHDRQFWRTGALAVLGLAAAVLSGSVVLDRVATTNEARIHKTRSANLPRVEARKALETAEARLARIEADQSAETKDGGCGRVCKGLKKDAEAARQRVAEARTKLVALGAHTAENPAAQVIASLLGVSPLAYQLFTPLALPLWLELAAPAVLAYGFAPRPRKAKPKKKAKRRRKKAAPRKPPSGASAKRKGQVIPFRPRLVAANDH